MKNRKQMKSTLGCLLLGMWLVSSLSSPLVACTSILVSRGASSDGSVMITYSADAPFMPRFLVLPPMDFKAGDKVDLLSLEDGQSHGQIPALPHEFGTVGLINEHQVSIGETTTGGREELQDPQGLLSYDPLMLLALRRSSSAREAIRQIDQLCSTYGYKSTGESLSIADKKEVWLMEIIGKGPGNKGIVWVAARVPDGYLSAHANMSRITTFPLHDPENWLYSPDVIDFAVAKGFYKKESGKPFSFRDAYHPDQSVVSRRVCGTRVWSIYRRSAPSQIFSDDFHRGVSGAEDYPLFIKPDKKLSTADVMSLMRDHYEGTPYDMTQGIDAGPFASPYRFRGLTWKVDEQTYAWERPISSQQAGFVMLAQSRDWLPDPVGGIYWFTPDDAYTSCFVPFYCSIRSLPAPYTQGDLNRFSLDSAWWIFNLVSNLTYDRYSRILPDVQKVQTELEKGFLQAQSSIDRTATALLESSPADTVNFLTRISHASGNESVMRWRELAADILTRHNDGYINELKGEPKGIGYNQEWLKRVAREKGDQLRISTPKK